MLTRAPGTSIRSPPIDIHPAWFDEKSGGAARCSAIAGALGITQIRLARMPPASTPSLTVNEYIVVPPRVLFLLLKRHWCVSCRQLSRRLTPLPIEVPEKLGFRHLPARILLGYSICGSAVRAPLAVWHRWPSAAHHLVQTGPSASRLRSKRSTSCSNSTNALAPWASACSPFCAVARVASPTAPVGCRSWVIQPKPTGRNALSHLKSSAIFTVTGTAAAARAMSTVSGLWARRSEVSTSPACTPWRCSRRSKVPDG